jgi:hypothetical protein
MCEFNGHGCDDAAAAEREVIIELIEANWEGWDDLISKDAVIELIRSLD